MRRRGLDYFENSRRATYVQQAYAIRNPKHFEGYGEHCWGVTASDGPGPATLRVRGVEREFFDYLARGVPFGPDDGTIAPWAAIASLPFAPEIVLPAIQHFDEFYPEMISTYGFKCSFNPTFSNGARDIQRLLWTRSRADRVDDRELPLRPGLAAHAPVRIHRPRVAPRGIHRRMVGVVRQSLTRAECTFG